MSCQISNSLQCSPCNSLSNSLSKFKDPSFVALSKLCTIVPATCGSLFNIISPVGGAIYGVSSLLAFIATGIIPDSNQDHLAFKIAQLAARIFTSITVGSLVSTALGHPISLIAAAKISAISFLPIAIGTTVAFIIIIAHRHFEFQKSMHEYRENQMKQHSL